MTSAISWILCALMLAPLCCGRAWAEGDDPGGVPYYTNRDIVKYGKGPEGAEPPSTSDGKSEKAERLRKIEEERGKEYWCKKAAPYRRKVDSARDEVRSAEKELAEDPADKKKGRALKKKLEGSRSRLKNAELDLAEIEGEAHRKGIPPGWLRCQFE